MLNNTITVNQPNTNYISFSLKTNDLRFVYDGVISRQFILKIGAADIQFFAGNSADVTNNTDTIKIYTTEFNGASSKYQINNNAQTTVNLGTNNLQGLGLFYSPISILNGAVELNTFIESNGANSTLIKTDMYNYIKQINNI
jgi:hypothetical protein